MPYYVNAQALLSDIRLRLDALGVNSTVLVVEGNDDKRLFYRWMVATSDVAPAGGKTLLRSALASMREEDKGHILFLTDCDYDVAAGTLQGGPDVVITATCDVESDLISLGVLERLAVEVVSLRATESKDSAAEVGTDVRNHAESAAAPMGRIRMAAQPLGVDLEFDDIDLSKYWDKERQVFLYDKLHKVVWDHLSKETDITRQEWEERLHKISEDARLCHGKDLLNASQMFFRTLYKMDNKITVNIFAMMMRLAVDHSIWESWPVVQRIRKWEGRYGRLILKPQSADAA